MWVYIGFYGQEMHPPEQLIYPRHLTEIICVQTCLNSVYLHIPKGWELIFHPTHCSKLSSLCQDVIQFKDEVQAAEIPKNLTDGLWKSIVICCVSVVASLASLASCVSPLWRPFRSPKSPQLRHRIITAPDHLKGLESFHKWPEVYPDISLDISRNSPTLSFNL